MRERFQRRQARPIDRAHQGDILRRRVQVLNSRPTSRTKALLALCMLGVVVAIPCSTASLLRSDGAQLAHVANSADRQELAQLVSSSNGRDPKVRPVPFLVQLAKCREARLSDCDTYNH